MNYVPRFAELLGRRSPREDNKNGDDQEPMDARPFWAIYQASFEIVCLENASMLKRIGSSRRRLETALDEIGLSDAVLVEFTAINGKLTDPRIVGHLTEGKDALLECVFPAAPPGEWLSH